MKIGLGIGVTQPQNMPLVAMQNPSSLFVSGANGAWYDPSDINLTWRRNLLTYSEQFDNAAWGKSNATVTANVVTAPDGTLTAEKIVETTATAFDHYILRIDFGSLSGSYTYSIYAKAGERQYLQLAGVDNNVAFRPIFDLAAGVVVSAAGTSAFIQSVGNGWYRCGWTKFATALTQVTAILQNSATYQSYTGDGTSGIYIWGAQLEVGSTATPYQRITDGVQDYLQYQSQPVLYQDAAGIIPVTAVEQPVGLMLDKSKGMVLGPELVTNGDFAGVANGTDVTTLPDWTAYGTPAFRDVQGERLRIQATAGSQGASLTLSTTIGKRYIFKATVAGDLGLASIYSDYTGDVSTLSGSVNVQFVATATSSVIFFRAANNSAGTTYYDNISVRELPGNHAFQSTSANRPTLSARYNLLNNTETLSTQSVTTRAAKYILSFWGTGSVTLSGTYTGTLVGTGTDNRVYVEFTTTAGTLTLTVTGSVLKAQLEEL